MMLKQRASIKENITFDLKSTLHTKFHSKWIIDISVKGKTVKTLKK